MHQTIHGKHVRITDNVKKHIAEKMLKLKHHSEKIIDSSIICEHIHNDYNVEIIILFGKKVFCMKSSDTDLYAAIDALFIKVEREIRKYNEKMHDHRMSNKDNATKEAIVDTTDVDAASDDHVQYDIEVETMRAKPVIDVVEAIMQCNANKKQYMGYYPIQKTDDLYSVKIAAVPVFIFKANDSDENHYIEIARNEEEYYDNVWNKMDIKVQNGHAIESNIEEYDMIESSTSKAVEHLIINKDQKFLVYVSSITSHVECVYKEANNKFKVIRTIDF